VVEAVSRDEQVWEEEVAAFSKERLYALEFSRE
jgi:hypothetical protein